MVYIELICWYSLRHTFLAEYELLRHEGSLEYDGWSVLNVEHSVNIQK